MLLAFHPQDTALRLLCALMPHIYTLSTRHTHCFCKHRTPQWADVVRINKSNQRMHFALEHTGRHSGPTLCARRWSKTRTSAPTRRSCCSTPGESHALQMLLKTPQLVGLIAHSCRHRALLQAGHCPLRPTHTHKHTYTVYTHIHTAHISATAGCKPTLHA